MTVSSAETLGSRVCLIQMAAALAARREDALRAAMREVVRHGLEDEAEEVLVQSYLFVGYPMALNALAAWRRVSERPAPAPQTGSWEQWSLRGQHVLAVVYGKQYERLRANIRSLHPDLEQWMVVEGYGKVLGREGLDLEWRELTIVALLAVLDVPRQLYSHLRGALNAGASHDRVEETLAAAMPFVADPEQRSRVREVWQRIRPRVLGKESDDVR